ncbi:MULTISPECIES: hypothetical protein [Methylomicrobium]|uniref:Uncharacterized protein n=1 Tax=Methylomicrobium album BG8 TaxID=686340 RepID=H8GGV1_METAL|nr:MULTISPECIES: hypothetical protein [Methylomicrobium]EIC30064.1 hypothetical protein Metal_2328 [Methylomicrobium album BG8]
MKHLYYPYAPGTVGARGDGSFTRGFVASACISAFQDVAHPDFKADYLRVLRHGLQGGTALAAGSHAARSLHQGDYTSALLSVAVGAAGVLLLENLLTDKVETKEAGDE